MSKTMNPRELITMAIQIEKNGSQYYTRMAENAKDDNIRDIFTYLASQEKDHISNFTRLQEAMGEDSLPVPDAYCSPEIAGYLEAMADGNVFSNLFPVEQIAGEIHSDQEAIRHAISFEKDSVLFFGEILGMLPPDEPNRPIVAELIRQEKIHIAKLYAFLGSKI